MNSCTISGRLIQLAEVTLFLRRALSLPWYVVNLSTNDRIFKSLIQHLKKNSKEEEFIQTVQEILIPERLLTVLRFQVCSAGSAAVLGSRIPCLLTTGGPP